MPKRPSGGRPRDTGRVRAGSWIFAPPRRRRRVLAAHAGNAGARRACRAARCPAGGAAGCYRAAGRARRAVGRGARWLLNVAKLQNRRLELALTPQLAAPRRLAPAASPRRPAEPPATRRPSDGRWLQGLAAAVPHRAAGGAASAGWSAWKGGADRLETLCPTLWRPPPSLLPPRAERLPGSRRTDRTNLPIFLRILDFFHSAVTVAATSTKGPNSS